MFADVIVKCLPGDISRLCISDFYTTFSFPVLLLLLLPVAHHRARALASTPGVKAGSRKFQGEPLLSSDEAASSKTRTARGWTFVVRRLFYSCCALSLCGLHVSLAIFAAAKDELPELQESGAPSGGVWRPMIAACHGCGAAMWAAVLCVVALEALRLRHSSRGLRLWWVACVVPAAVRLASDAIREGGAPTRERAVHLAASALAVAMGVAASFEPDTPIVRPAAHPSGEQAAAEPSAEATASFASRLFFSWADPLLRLGSRRPLEHTDLDGYQTLTTVLTRLQYD
jgi:hypothetical protein